MKRRPHCNGYTLVETLVAAGILALGVGAAASFAAVLVSQEETNLRVSRALGHLENAAQLYQLGLEPAEVSALLPEEPAVTNLTLTEDLTDLGGGLGNLEYADIAVTFESDAAGATRTETVRAYRQRAPRSVP